MYHEFEEDSTQHSLVSDYRETALKYLFRSTSGRSRKGEDIYLSSSYATHGEIFSLQYEHEKTLFQPETAK